MTDKNKKKLERKEKRLPPIPYTRIEPSKKQKLEKKRKKHKNTVDDSEGACSSPYGVIP